MFFDEIVYFFFIYLLNIGKDSLYDFYIFFGIFIFKFIYKGKYKVFYCFNNLLDFCIFCFRNFLKIFDIEDYKIKYFNYFFILYLILL